MGTTRYFWDPIEDNVVKEYDENGDTIVRYTTEPDLYGNLISQERAGVASYPHYDAQGSTLALTNNNGDITDEYAYNAFGEATEQSGTTVHSRRYHGEIGYEYGGDGEVFGYYIRARSYQPSIARWLSVDPVGLAAGINQFLYVYNAPIRYSDPAGLACRVCAQHISYSDRTATLDSFLIGPTYTALARIASHNIADLRLTYPELTHAGVWSVTNPEYRLRQRDGTLVLARAGAFVGASYLFFVSFAICEDRRGECQLFLDETGSTTLVDGVRRPDEDGRDYGDITDHEEVKNRPLRIPWDECDRVLIYMDNPDGFAVVQEGLPLPLTTFLTTVQQRIEIRERGSGEVKATVRHQVQIGVDKTGTVISSP